MSRHCSRSLHKIHVRRTDIKESNKDCAVHAWACPLQRLRRFVILQQMGTWPLLSGLIAGHTLPAAQAQSEERSREQKAMLALASVELTGDKVGSDNGCTTLGVRRYGLPTPSLHASKSIAAHIMNAQTSQRHLKDMGYCWLDALAG